MHNNFWN